MKKQVNFSAINLGCNKNMVDTEFTIGEILKLNSSEVEINFYPDPEDEEVEYVIINTCGFLSSSRDEAEETIWAYDNMGKKVILIGCYVPVKDDSFLSSLKNLEAVVPYEEVKNTSSILLNNISLPNGEGIEQKISKLKTGLANLKKDKLKAYLSSIGGDQIGTKAHIYGTESVRAFLHSYKGYEYLKIAEGCNNKCSFCIIPNIRGKQRSRTIEDILEEVKIMVNSGIKEIEIISQDTTRYGVDLYKAPYLLELLEKIDEIPGDFKIRLFYMYPDILSLTHIDRLANLKKLLPYFDFPFQHISPNVLKNMNRFYDDSHISKIIDYIKEKFPNNFFHTNFIIGFPGETEDDFNMLLDFAKKYEFDSVSVFGYHDEPLADSNKLANKIDAKTIKNRVKTMKTLLNEIYDKKDKARLNTKQIGYIEELYEDYAIIRPEIKAPEIDDLDKVDFADIDGDFDLDLGMIVEYVYRGELKE
ncbi:MAG: MiaB/RimO family radical SAM methylthiotransferase [Candidatus Gracilibacteria bacterium]|nr:MiaB/RimO family radical SAM methylthiotransferase [Candidatus Gracilibacteria bacterium]